MKYTILGSRGLIGSALTDFLKGQGHQVSTAEPKDIIGTSDNLGFVIYAIGLTADFRTRIPDTLEAHVCVLKKILDQTNFNGFLYLSSTRVYQGNETTDENVSLSANPHDKSDFYNISKMMGEAYCLQCDKPTIKIARLSNVVGHDPNSENFINDVIKSALNDGHINLQTNPESEKDFIDLQDVLEMIEKITTLGKEKLYNIASGKNISLKKICEYVANETGAKLTMNNDLQNHTFPNINVSRLKNEFDYKPRDITSTIKNIIKQTK